VPGLFQLVDPPGFAVSFQPKELKMPHKFKCHDSVLLTPLRFTSPKADPTQVYEVVRLMPPDRQGENGYRIRAGTVERAVVECEIRCC